MTPADGRQTRGVRKQYHLRANESGGLGRDAWDVDRLIELTVGLPIKQVLLEGQRIEARASIGAASSPRDAATAEDLLKTPTWPCTRPRPRDAAGWASSTNP